MWKECMLEASRLATESVTSFCSECTTVVPPQTTNADNEQKRVGGLWKRRSKPTAPMTNRDNCRAIDQN